MIEAGVDSFASRLKRHKAGGHTHLHFEHLKGWLQEAYPDRYTNPPNLGLWEKLVTLVQNMWKHSTLSTDLIWDILVFLPKGNLYTHGGGFLEVMWKVFNAVTNTGVKIDVRFHDVLHGFRSHQGTGMAIMELNMSQGLSSIYQYPLFLVFLYLKNSYDMSDCLRLLNTLEVYGAGTKICGFLEEFW